MSYDLIVLGGGPAGYLGAKRAGEGGLKTLLIEKEYIGGVCLNVGCIPTKTLLNSAKIFDKSRYSSSFGVNAQNVEFDHQQVLERKNKVVNKLVQGVKKSLEEQDIDIVKNTGYLLEKENKSFRVKAGDKIYKGERLLLATGSLPIQPDIPGLLEAREKNFVLTSKEILELDSLPDSLIVIGGGYIGLEMSSYFNSAGSEVVVIEMLDHIGGEIDKDIGQILLKSLNDKGINFRLNSQVIKINNNRVIFESEGMKKSLEADKILLSVGRKPFIEGFGLDNLGVDIDSNYISIDEHCQTNIPGVYAAGDVIGHSMLAHTAYREAEVSVNNMLNKHDVMRYDAIPSVIYTNPEVASAGLTAAQAKKTGIKYDEIKIPMAYSGRYVSENENSNGICKLLVDKKFHRLIGVHLIGSYSSEIIYGASFMIENEMRIDDIKEFVFPHPTVSEIIREGVFRI